MANMNYHQYEITQINHRRHNKTHVKEEGTKQIKNAKLLV